LARAILGGMADQPDGPDQPDGTAARSRDQRAWMVATQLRTRGIRDERVMAALLEVPRDQFVPDWQRGAAYADEALPIPSGQTISQPYIVARMTELLKVEPGERVMEIGTGSGYQAAVLAALGCRVTTIERHAELAAAARERLVRLGFGETVEVRVGDGSLGAPDGAPWPAILVTAAAPSVPVRLREQLDPEGGRLVVPVGSRERQDLIVVERHGNEWIEHNDGPVVFVPLVGEAGFPE
jgi:protein-L-isoaspartate(D-aspartate) O-methyltransferase